MCYSPRKPGCSKQECFSNAQQTDPERQNCNYLSLKRDILCLSCCKTTVSMSTFPKQFENCTLQDDKQQSLNSRKATCLSCNGKHNQGGCNAIQTQMSVKSESLSTSLHVSSTMKQFFFLYLSWFIKLYLTQRKWMRQDQDSCVILLF